MAFDPLYLEPGELRHSVTILAANPAQRDAAGQPIPGDWTTVLTTRAKIENRSGRDAVSDDEVTSQTTYMITLRWSGSAVTIQPGMRLQHSSDLYLIQAIDNVLRRNRKLRLTCLAIDEVSN